MEPIGAFLSLVSGHNMGPFWACPYGQAIWATHGSIIGVSLCACPHWTHIGTIWAAHVGLAVWDHHTWGHIGLLSGPYMGPLWTAHMGLAVWETYGSFMGLPIWAYLYELAIWAPHGSIMGTPYEIVSIGPICVV